MKVLMRLQTVPVALHEEEINKHYYIHTLRTILYTDECLFNINHTMT